LRVLLTSKKGLFATKLVTLLNYPLRNVKKNHYSTAIQTLQRVGKGKEGGECVRRLGWGKYLEEPQGGNDLVGLFSRGKTIGVQPQLI
jgi:hypothetical protein